MKKILLSLFIVCGGVNIALGAQMCNKTSDGKVVCNYISVGGGAEQGLCYKDKANNDEPNPDPTVWTEGNRYLWVKPIGGDCTEGKTGATLAKCIKNEDNSRSCAAFECKSDYLLYTTNTRSEIQVVGKNYKVGSQGLCRKKTDLKAICGTGCGCADNEKCELNPVKVQNHNKDVDAFIGEELCICVPKQSADEYCTYTFEGKVQCTNGASTTTRDNLQIKKSELNGVECSQEQQTFSTWYNTNKDKLKNWFNANCKNPTIIKGSVSNGNAKLENAKQKIQEFFKFAEDNKSGWETADGKFNTKRLASDLSAGVVLGTVGGVVSGVVIKKKQVEKGFDALHCTVGGQTVADWGDEFSVGFQR